MPVFCPGKAIVCIFQEACSFVLLTLDAALSVESTSIIMMIKSVVLIWGVGSS